MADPKTPDAKPDAKPEPVKPAAKDGDPGINASVIADRPARTLADDLPAGDPGINAHITS